MRGLSGVYVLAVGRRMAFRWQERKREEEDEIKSELGTRETSSLFSTS